VHAWGAPGGEDGEEGKQADSREAKARNLAKISSFSEFSGNGNPVFALRVGGWYRLPVRPAGLLMSARFCLQLHF
jgi:hypothetical protein